MTLTVPLPPRFALADLWFTRSNIIDLTNQQYNELLAAREVLLDTAQIDEKFFSISEHYRELEEFCFSAGIEGVLYQRTDARAIFVTGFQFGRRLSALLTAVGLYMDSVVSHGRTITSRNVPDERFSELKSVEYDKSYEYRVMEAMRNYVKHHGYPVHLTSFGRNRPKDQETMEFRTSFHFDISHIDRTSFKPQRVREEIEKWGGKLELKNCVRSYFSSICDLHTNYRKLIEQYKEEAEATIKYWQDIWSQTFPADGFTGVAACKLDGQEPDEAFKTVYLSIHFDEYRKWLEERTQILVNMRHRRAIIY